jgi:hypothetical protein
MPSREVHGTAANERTKKWFFTFAEQWSDFLHARKMNWLDFTLIKIQGEKCRMTGRYELELGLLGFNATVTYVYDPSFNESMLSLREQIGARIRAEHGQDVTIEDPFGALDGLEEKKP